MATTGGGALTTGGVIVDGGCYQTITTTQVISTSNVVTTAGVDAMTLGAPTTTTDDGVTITVYSNTAQAHTITATGLLQVGSSNAANVATFTAQKGAGLILQAYQGKWNVLGATGQPFT